MGGKRRWVAQRMSRPHAFDPASRMVKVAIANFCSYVHSKGSEKL